MDTKTTLTIALPPNIVMTIVHDFGGITAAQQYLKSCKGATLSHSQTDDVRQKALYLREVLEPLLRGKVRLDDIPLPKVQQLIKTPVRFEEHLYMLLDGTGEAMLRWTPTEAIMSANSWPPSRIQAAERLATFFQQSNAFFGQLLSTTDTVRKTTSSASMSTQQNSDIIFNFAGFSGLITNYY